MSTTIATNGIGFHCSSSSHAGLGESACGHTSRQQRRADELDIHFFISFVGYVAAPEHQDHSSVPNYLKLIALVAGLAAFLVTHGFTETSASAITSLIVGVVIALVTWAMGLGRNNLPL
jgi:hypothetical protein